MSLSVRVKGSSTDHRVDIQDSVTVEYSKMPGQAFYRKSLKWVTTRQHVGAGLADENAYSALKLQMKAMLLSTAYNSVQTVCTNIHHAFLETAQKIYHYRASLPFAKRPRDTLMISKHLLPSA